MADKRAVQAREKSNRLPQKEVEPDIECTMEICKETSSSESMKNLSQSEGTKDKTSQGKKDSRVRESKAHKRPYSNSEGKTTPYQKSALLPSRSSLFKPNGNEFLRSDTISKVQMGDEI